MKFWQDLIGVATDLAKYLAPIAGILFILCFVRGLFRKREKSNPNPFPALRDDERDWQALEDEIAGRIPK